MKHNPSISRPWSLAKRPPKTRDSMNETLSTRTPSSSNERPKKHASSNWQSCSRRESFGFGTAFFLTAWLWHVRAIPAIYNFAGREVLAVVALYPDMVETFQEEHGLRDQATTRDFAFLGAFTHTVVFMFGLVCASLIQKAREVVFASHKARAEPMEIVGSITLILWIVAVFHSLAWRFLYFCFETQLGPVFQFGKLFFREKSGSSPFAWTSSVSYSAALTLGLLLKGNEDWTAIQRIREPLLSVQSWLTAVGLPFVIWLATLDKVTLPFLEAAQAASLADAEKDQGGGSSRSIAFVLGIAMCCIFPTVLVSIREVSIALVPLQGVPQAGTKHSLKKVFHTFLWSLIVSTLLITISLEGSFRFSNAIFSLRAMAHVFIQPRFAVLFVLLPMASLLLGTWIIQRPLTPWRWVPAWVTTPFTNIKRIVFVSLLWNCYLVGWWGSFLPFQVYGYVLRSRYDTAYSIGQAAFDGWMFVFCGSYIFPVVFQGSLKVFSAKLKVPWGRTQECLVAVGLTVPLSLMLWHYWVNDMYALPVMIGMTIIHLTYLLATWRNRPEITGWRFSKQLRLLDCWKILEEYFDQQIIVEGCGVNTKDPTQCNKKVNWTPNKSNYDYDAKDFGAPTPRMIGFHPHGLFPCTLVWAHLTPKWRSIFGTSMPRPLTDAFIHTIPFMREFAQWAGSLEVSRPVVKSCLSKGETIILVPGGQGEILFHTSENLQRKRMVICDRHRGFIRVALEHGAELVPSISFGELQAIQNINCPPLQRLTRKVLGFPLPFFPVGRLGLLPIPNPVQMTYVLGQPIPTRSFCANPGAPTESEVEQMHAHYFRSLTQLFDKWKAEAGYPDWSIVLSSELRAQRENEVTKRSI